MLIPFIKIVEKYNIRPKGIIHVGGHWGEEARDYEECDVEKTIWIEADESAVQIMAEHLEEMNFMSTIINTCVGDVDGKEVTFNISNNDGQSSSILDLEYHKIAHQEVHYVDSVNMVTNTLNTLLKEYEDIKDYTFLNADIQGAELLMLKGATEIIPNLDCIYLEVNEKELYKGCGLVGEIDEFLKPFGFTRVETEWCGNFGWGDAVYLRK